MKRVLVIEDDEKIQESILDLLELRNYQVYVASNGREGIRIAQEKVPDVILCDIMMNNLNGFSVLQAIRAIPALAKTPFVFVSALSEQKYVDMAMNQGANRFVIKPFRADDLYNAIEDSPSNPQLL